MSATDLQLRLGSLAIDFPVVQAALSGYSDWPMRRIARRLGAGFTICEVLLDRFVLDVTKGKKAARYLHISDEDHPVGAQLMGSDPAQFGRAAKKLAEIGFDAIDVNFGCPVKKVVGKCRGGYLLSQPDTALRIVAEVRNAVRPKIPVTVKMRRGMDDTPQSRERFFEIFDGAFALGVDAVTVHGRTVRQRYEGRSSWGFLAEVKRRAGDRTILGSGDLFSAADCLAMMAQTGVDGVTAARGAIGNPWIFAEARALAVGLPLPDPPSVREQREVLLEHYDLVERLYGPKHAPYKMRGTAIKYSARHPRHAAVRAALVKVRSRQEWEDVLEQYYAIDQPGLHVGAETHGAEQECGRAA
jgi:nifR3 family TIM-barrel protein